MRILHVVESLEVGGAEMVVVNLVNRMAKDHELAICCVKKVGPFKERLLSKIPVYCLHKEEGNSLKIPFQIASLIRREKFNVVHIHFWGLLFDASLGARLGKDVVKVFTVHGEPLYYSLTYMGRIKKKIRYLLDCFAFRMIDEVITVSKPLEKLVMEEYSISSDKISTIYNGVLPPDFGHSIKKGNSRKEIVIITVGRLAEEKNYAMMLEAFSKAIGFATLPMRLIVVGDGPEKLFLEKKAQSLGILGKVSFLGFRDDVFSLLSSGHIFAITSNYEGVSIAILEAMRIGLPVVATKVGGNVETVVDGKTGLLIPRGDVGACVDALVVLANDADKRMMLGNQGRDRVNIFFNLNKAVDTHLEIYTKAKKGIEH